MSVIDQIVSRHFSAKTLRKLAKRGVKIIGLQGYPVTYANGSTGTETAYCVDDNGTGRVLSLTQIFARAEGNA